MSDSKLHVTVWNEFVSEKTHDTVRKIYPAGMHTVFKEAIEEHLGAEARVRVALLEHPEQGLSEEVLGATDVLTWWGHAAHDQLKDEVVDRVQRRVLEGMGLVVLHSAHASKIFRRLMGTSCMLRWREAAEKERIWCVNPGHPVADGLEGEYFELEQAEMYGEFFEIPDPDELIFVSWFEGGEVFRSGCTFIRGKGRIFYWRPGHETFPVYYDPHVRRVLANGVRYVAPRSSAPVRLGGRQIKDPLSPIGAG